MDYSKIAEEIREFLKEKLEETGAEGYVIGVSGGIDSAVTTKLAVDAVGVEKVNAWIMPGKPSNPDNTRDAQQLCKDLGLNYNLVNIESTVEAFCESTPFEMGKETVGNLRARTRMVHEYADANENNLMVLGTGNRSELLIGYFTKYGDAATDISPIADLYKSEVRELAKHIGIDDKFIKKQPSAGLWEGHTDEDEIGMSYTQIDEILRLMVDQDKTVEEITGSGIDRDKVERIEKMYQSSEHKRSMSQILHLR